MKATYSGSRTYTLFDDKEHVLGRLHYPSMFSQKSVISFRDDAATPINVKPKGLGSTLSFLRGDEEMGLGKMKWGKIHIKLKVHERERTLLFKRTGFWRSTFVLLNEYQEQLVSIVPKFSWKTWRYDYMIDRTRGERYAVDDTTILLAVYCTNYVMAAARSAA